MWSAIRGLYDYLIVSINSFTPTRPSQFHPNWSIYGLNDDGNLKQLMESYKWQFLRYRNKILLALDTSGRLIYFKNNAYKCLTIDPSILDVQMSNDHLYIHYKCGRVKFVKDFVKKLEFDDPKYIDNLPVPGLILGLGRIASMSIGAGHAGFVTSDGDLFIGGSNYYGQSAQKPKKLYQDSTNYEITDDVDADESVMNGIKKVSCGSRHTVCLDKSGNVYSFGDDSQLQLGLGDTRGLAINQVRDVNSTSVAPITISVPLKHLVTYKKRERHLKYIPQKLPLVAEDIATGDDFTIIKSQNSLLACGNNIHGQCGNNLTTQHQIFLPVKLPRYKINSLSCGKQHCVAQLNDNKTYFWGYSNLLNSHGIVCPPKKFDLRGNIFCQDDVTIVNY